MEVGEEDLADLARLDPLLSESHERRGPAVDQKEVVGAADGDTGLETPPAAESIAATHKAYFDRSHSPVGRG
jgi:hypothetical protein